MALVDRFLIEAWKNRIRAGEYSSATTFLLKLTAPGTAMATKQFIVKNLDDWHVIAATHFEMDRHIEKLEELAKDNDFSGKQTAALLCSKVHYCLGRYEQALDCALASEDEFKLVANREDPTGQDALYVKTIIRQALNTYKRERTTTEENNQSGHSELGLEVLVDRIFNQNLQSKDYSLVVGFALDTRRLDMIGNAIELCAKGGGDPATILDETLRMVHACGAQMDIQFRDRVYDLVYQWLEKQKDRDYFAMTQCLVKLGRPQTMADVLKQLMAEDNRLMAYQLAFDLNENAPQSFLKQMEQHLFVPETDEKTSMDTGDESKTETEEKPQKSTGANEKNDAEDQAKNAILRRILNGEEAIKNHMQFLIKNNHTDMLVLKQLKESSRVNCTHNAVVIANGLMHTGTTCDDFLRENLDWISKATNWNKFNAVASLGLIHRGHERDAKKLLDPYLPKGEQDQFGYKEGGSLFAYGLIHANHGSLLVIQYLLEQLSKASTSVVRHGACLGLGTAALGSCDMKVYEHLKEVLYQNEAVPGEAAGTAMGLVMAGSMNEEIFNEMYQFVLETQHDKIQRGLRSGIAMLAYGAMEKAEKWIARLEDNSEAMLRQTAVCMMALAYVGTGKASVIGRLLGKVATDPNNDVKRFATIGIGFILSSNPQQCLDYTELLKEHFNGHIRYGAAIALAISCAGTGYKEAIALLEPMLQAKENFVRQGAVIALSIVLIQQTGPTCPNVLKFRKTLTKMITEKGEDTITKFGAIIAQGILDAGGRNVTVSLHNRNGQPSMPSVLGMFTFLQYWYWHAMTHCVSLAFQPTCLIGLNIDLKMPKMEFRCNAKPSLFAYPPPMEEGRKEEQEKVETAVLSITNKKAGDKKKAETGETKMEVDATKETQKPAAEEEKQSEKEKQKELPEQSFQNLPNPTRAVRLQLRAMAMPDNSPYKVAKPINQGGIVMVQKVDSKQPEELVELAIAGGTISEAAKETAEPVKAHDSFEFMFSAY